MPTVTLTKGLPGSGKTRWAKVEQALDPNIVLVSKDDLRAMLHGGKWSKANEKQVLHLRDEIIRTALRDGRNIIVHDTNLLEKHEADIRYICELMRDQGIMARVEIKSFLDIDIETCIKNDLKRSDSVGKDVIMKMYREHILGDKKFIPFHESKDPKLPDAIIVDIDGTLAHATNRGPYDVTKYADDAIDDVIASVVHAYADTGVQVVICTGRDERYKDVTEAWLDKHHIFYTDIFMRPAEDIRKDSIIKTEIYNNYIKDIYNVVFVLDDRQQVVDAWRLLGLKVLQCAPGDF